MKDTDKVTLTVGQLKKLIKESSIRGNILKTEGGWNGFIYDMETYTDYRVLRNQIRKTPNGEELWVGLININDGEDDIEYEGQVTTYKNKYGGKEYQIDLNKLTKIVSD